MPGRQKEQVSISWPIIGITLLALIPASVGILLDIKHVLDNYWLSEDYLRREARKHHEAPAGAKVENRGCVVWVSFETTVCWFSNSLKYFKIPSIEKWGCASSP